MKPLLALLAVFLLAGCYLQSERPLVQRAEGTAPFGPRFALLSEDQGGGVQVDKNGAPSFMNMVFRGGAYRAEDAGPEFVFAPLPGAPEVHLVQYAPGRNAEGKEQGVAYLAARAFGGELRARLIDMDAAPKAVLEANGIPTEKDESLKVADRAVLDEVLRIWSAVNLRKLSDPEFYALRYRLATTPREIAALEGTALAAACLALAGHPEDAGLEMLQKSRRGGVAMGSIEADRAIPACRAAAERDGRASVRYALARTYDQEERFAEAAPLVRGLVDEGFGLGFVLAGNNAVTGRGEPKDPARGRRILEAGAARGSAAAAYSLGYFHMYGQFGTNDYAAARRALGTAASGGHADAHYLLGLLDQGGWGGPKDEAAAFRAFERAAAGGSRSGAYEAGRALYFGNGTSKNRDAAFELFEQAAEADHATAAYYTGFMLARGQGTTKAEKKAAEWLKKAHEAGVTAATGEYGRMLYHGLGTTANRAEGKRLMETAAAAGVESAKSYLQQIAAPATGGSGSSSSSSSSSSSGSRDILAGKNVPSDQARDLRRIAQGRPFELTEANLPFMIGMASDLTERCRAPSGSVAERTELAAFVASGALGGMMGFDYSNPNLGESLGSNMRSQSLTLAGAVFARQLACGREADTFASGIVKALRSNARGADGGASRFVSSCARHFGEQRCGCLANVGRQAIPDLHRRSYDRRLIREIIDRNPFVGLQIATVCGIVNY